MRLEILCVRSFWGKVVSEKERDKGVCVGGYVRGLFLE